MAIEYKAQASSQLINGEATLTIAEKSFTAAASFDIAEIPYAEVNAIELKDYAVTVKTDGGKYEFSRMGEWAERFFDALCEQYNNAVLHSMFVSGKPIVTAKGEYRYAESGASGSGAAVPVYVFDNCVAALPPDLGARRIPLCFVSAMDKGDYSLEIKLDSGESYAFSRLGFDTTPIESAIEKQKRALLEKALQSIKEIDPSVQTAQASQLAKLLQEGTAAPFGQLAAISPSFVMAVEGKIGETRAAEYYNALKTICDPACIYVGFQKNENGFAFWFIAPSPDGRFATVEFSEADTATFVYQTGGNFEAFARQLSRALEAINFKREVIRLSDEELRKPEYADYYMAAKRTAALQLIRKSFAARVIHSSPDAWQAKLEEAWQ